MTNATLPLSSLKLERPLVLVVAVLLIDEQKRVLLAQRPSGKPMAGLWEFPGGKIDKGELPEEALARELREELGIEISTGNLVPMIFASHTYEDFHLLMPLFACRVWKGTPHPCEGQTLVWASKEEWHHYPMPPADDRILPLLMDLL